MQSHVIVLLALGALVACSSAPRQEPKQPTELEACVASSTAQGTLEAPGISASAILQPGDIACFAVDSAHNVQALPQVPASEPHISARMTAESGMTMLTVKNGTSSNLTYRALMRVPGAADWQETSIVPVMAGLLGIESWPHPIDAIAMFELRQDSGR